MKDWVRSNAAAVPSGLTADNTSHQLRDGLRRAGWQVRQSDEQVVLIPPDGPRPSSGQLPPPHAGTVTADELGRWRRSILRLLDSLDNRPADKQGVGSRIRSLAAAGRIPRQVAACMHVVVEVRNVSEYDPPRFLPRSAQQLVLAGLP